VTLQRSGGGVFEIRVDDRIAFSKKTLGRFPTDAEIVAVVT
jgi:selT/selW/selH-like putative selenoprotein